jgi:RNA polymerase sigma-70 factor (ECF subfamily)
MGDHQPTPRLPPEAAISPAPPERRVGLAQAAAGGDVRATRELLEQVAPRVVRAVKAVMGPAHPEVDDATQLALIAFIQALPGFRSECPPVQFAARIAVRTAAAVRRRAAARRVGHDPSVDVDTLEVAPEELDAERRRAAVRALLDELPEEQAEALALRLMLGWSVKEIAEATCTPLNTVRSRMRLAKDALRKRVAEDPALAAALDRATGAS